MYAVLNPLVTDVNSGFSVWLLTKGLEEKEKKRESQQAFNCHYENRLCCLTIQTFYNLVNKINSPGVK